MHDSMIAMFILKPVRFGQSPSLSWNGPYRKHQIKLLYWHKSASSNRPITVRSLPFAGVSVFTSLRGACYCCCSLSRPAVPVCSLNGFCTKPDNGHFYRKKNYVWVSVHHTLIYIKKTNLMQSSSMFIGNCKIALHVSAAFCVHLQEH